MKPTPLQPAEVEFDADGAPPRSPLYGDLYHPQAGALPQAQHVFLQGNGLPGRWAGRADFVVLETGFGLGNNFLATWDAWRNDPARCQRLHLVSVERHPLAAADLAQAHAASPWPALAAQLRQAWPPLSPGLHLLDFEGGRVRLLLALGDASTLLPRLRLQADAIYLDGFAPARNPEMWQPALLQALGRLAAPGATAATWSAAGSLRAGLASAGFEAHLAPGTGGKREITLARYAPRFTPRRLPGAAPAIVTASKAGAQHRAVVVGAGLAGAAAAQALTQLGVAVTVLEQADAPARQASGNPAGLFHGTVNTDDGPYARLFRAAARLAQQVYGPAVANRVVPGSVQGLLRLGRPGQTVQQMQAQLAELGLPAGYVQALDAAAASARAGVPLPGPAWFYPGGGWLQPAAWVRHALATPGVTLRTGLSAASLQRSASGLWAVCDGQNSVLAEADSVVLAAAEATAPLLQASPGLQPQPAWPLHRTRGQVSFWHGPGAQDGSALRIAVAGDGYAIPLPGGGLLCGATRQEGDHDAQLRDADHALNLQRLQRLTGLQPPATAQALQGRVGWRLHSGDRLPVAGALPLLRDGPQAQALAQAITQPREQRRDQARLLARHPGLFVISALGARGITLAPLLARLVAAQATGTPWPLPQELADAVDPARWLVRAARQRSGAGNPP